MSSTHHIHILPNGRQIPATPGRNLMESLMDQSVFLRSDCGGKGTCGKCRVKKKLENGNHEIINSCTYTVTEDIKIEIPESSMLSSHIISKAPASLPDVFMDRFKNNSGNQCYGIAVDLGTTTIALYLCDTHKGKILSSLSHKNPQAFYGDDVMSRIGAIGQDKKNLKHLQKLVVRTIEWGIKDLLESLGLQESMVSEMVVVGNPAMIHIFAGVDPESIGVSPYMPAFYKAKNIQTNELGFRLEDVSIQILPQISGFIGGDILSAAVAADLENKPEGTLLVDLGTNGELMLKANGKFYATSCATGPAFEGASLSCGMQAIPGAINKVQIKGQTSLPEYTFINPSKHAGLKPSGICGTGVISAVAQLCKNNIIAPGGAFQKDLILSMLKKDASGNMVYGIVQENFSKEGSKIFISQKDIRSVQLGKAALITGIEFLLKEAGIDKPEKIIVAGAFGSFLDKKDMMTLGMIPIMDPAKVEIAGNLAGVGAVMVLCDDTCLKKTIEMAKKIHVVDLACDKNFQEVFIKRLNFPNRFSFGDIDYCLGDAHQ
ncbi:MAG: ASKHA domain-containing protein [Desulfobacula sp.]|nr:ASKHA domain-containing protein [Desulfobacula sp.]